MKALEAADAARRKEAQRAAERVQQRQQLEAQKAERAKRAHDAKACPWDQPSTLFRKITLGLAVVHLLTAIAWLRLSGPCKPMAHLRLVGEVQSRQHCQFNEGEYFDEGITRRSPRRRGRRRRGAWRRRRWRRGTRRQMPEGEQHLYLQTLVEGTCLCASHSGT